MRKYVRHSYQYFIILLVLWVDFNHVKTAVCPVTCKPSLGWIWRFVNSDSTNTDILATTGCLILESQKFVGFLELMNFYRVFDFYHNIAYSQNSQ